MTASLLTHRSSSDTDPGADLPCDLADTPLDSRLPCLTSPDEVSVEVAVFMAPNRQAAWCWYASPTDWAAGPLYSASRRNLPAYEWFAAGEAMRRFSDSRIHFLTSDASLAERLNSNKRLVPRKRKKLSRTQLAVTAFSPREHLSAQRGTPHAALEIASSLPRRLCGPSAVFSGGGRLILDGVETTVLFSDGSADDSSAGWAYTNGREVVSGSLPAGTSATEAELTAGLEAVSSVSTPAALLYADCLSVVTAVSPPPNKKYSTSPLHRRLAEAAARVPHISAHKVYGHAGVPGNRVVDRAARLARLAGGSPRS